MIRMKKVTRGIYLAIAIMVAISLILIPGCGGEEPAPMPSPAPSTAPSPAAPSPAPVPEPAPIVTPRPTTAPAPIPAPTPPPIIPAPAPYPGSHPIEIPPPSIVIPGQETIGLAAGGAKDIGNFRQNIQQGYLPLPTDITYEGLFYDYYFDTGDPGRCSSLFCPSYSYAVTEDPFSGETEHYLAVGLNSGMKESDFERKKLNLVVVLDVSGSMNHPFDSYYYDSAGREVYLEDEDDQKRKIELANEAVVTMLDHLEDDDYFGMVLFDGGASLAKPLNRVGSTDMRAIKGHIMDITAGGSTNLDAGMRLATELFDEVSGADPEKYENRIILLTDAMPNQGDTSERSMLGMMKKNASQKIHTTVIGIGVDFNTELVEYITKTRGANYYSVHSSRQFRHRMDDEFENMVTPLVFNLQLRLDAEGWEIEQVYGSPEADQATGELMKVNTLFPSERQDGETRGGLILLKLRKTSWWNDGRLTLRAMYEDRNGNLDGSEVRIDLDDEEPESFENGGIRKGVLLARYADLLKNWAIDEREHAHYSKPWEPRIDDWVGIVVPPPISSLGQWERQSLPLMVSPDYEELFDEFADYFEDEMDEIDDDTLEQELDILEKLARY